MTLGQIVEQIRHAKSKQELRDVAARAAHDGYNREAAKVLNDEMRKRWKELSEWNRYRQELS